MLPSRQLDSTGLEEAYYRLFRDFFDKAEKSAAGRSATTFPGTR